MVLALETSVPKGRRGDFPYLFTLALSFITALYVLFGGLGYASFGRLATVGLSALLVTSHDRGRHTEYHHAQPAAGHLSQLHQGLPLLLPLLHIPW